MYFQFEKIFLIWPVHLHSLKPLAVPILYIFHGYKILKWVMCMSQGLLHLNIL